MASITKRGNAWRVQVKKAGVRKTATFDTKTEAKEWASKQESAMESRHEISNKIFCWELFERYRREVVPHHKGARWETVRLRKLENILGRYTLQELVDTDALAVWKADRLKEVQPASVRREMSLLNQVFSVAMQEWKLCKINPLASIKKPPNGKPRNRLISPTELENMWAELGYQQGIVADTGKQQVGLALHIALETAMRAGEILSLKPASGVKVVHLEDTKNSTARDVPLSLTARNLLTSIPEGGFTIDTDTMSALFAKARTKCGYANGYEGGFTFHDSRANALTNLSKKLDVLALAKMVGHRDPRSLMIYYRESAEDIADRL